MNDYVVIYPEIVAEIIKNNEEDIFALWLHAKSLNTEKNGIVSIKSVIQYCSETQNIKSNFVYTKINKGIGKYWRKPYGKNGNKSIGLLSIGNIIKRLAPKITRVEPVVVPRKLFIDSSKNIRSLLICLVAGRYVDSRPLSFYSLIHNLGISESAIRNAIKDCVYINVYKNFDTVAESISRDSLVPIMQSQSTPWSYKILSNENIFKLVKQLPNSYELIFKRLPLKQRPKELKKNDKLLLDFLEPKRYH